MFCRRNGDSFDKADLVEVELGTLLLQLMVPPFMEREGLGGYPKRKRRNRCYYYVYKSDFQITDVEIIPLIDSLMQKTLLYFSK